MPSMRASGALAALCFMHPIRAAEGPWIDMFNGRNLDGWVGQAAHWEVKDSAITVKGPITSNTFLVWKTPESDFLLEADVLVPGTGEANTGIQFRSRVMDSAKGTTPWKVCGPQADIGPAKFGALYEECTGRVVPPDSTKCRSAQKPNAWNHYALRVDGNRWTLKMNDAICFEYQDKGAPLHAAPGAVALQYHAPGYPFSARNIRMKRLNVAVSALPASPARLTKGSAAGPGAGSGFRWDGRWLRSDAGNAMPRIPAGARAR